VTPDAWQPEDLAPIVNHCLDQFGPDRVMFASDWPVCTLGAPLAQWVDALKQIVASRPRDEQKKLFHDNAQKFYGLVS
jgi:predicted TIM-barrel fold metal-dependent hydrolase